jgi:hypothetical protein
MWSYPLILSYRVALPPPTAPTGQIAAVLGFDRYPNFYPKNLAATNTSRDRMSRKGKKSSWFSRPLLTLKRHMFVVYILKFLLKSLSMSHMILNRPRCLHLRFAKSRKTATSPNVPV